MERIVVCYSRSGNTLRAAREAAAQMGARLIEIKEENPKKGFLGFMACGMYSTFGWPSKILPVDMPSEKPELTLICGPIWAGRMSAPIRAFLMQYKGRMGDVAYIITRGDQKNEYRAAMKEMDSLLARESRGGLSLPAGIVDLDMRSSVSALVNGV